MTPRLPLPILLLMAFAFGCTPREPVTYHANRTVNVNIPLLRIKPELRQSNYGPSCSHAGFHNGLAVAGLFPIIKDWRKHYGGGAVGDWIAILALRYKLKTRSTRNGSLRFLVACHKAGVPALIHYYDEHSVTFVRFSRDFKTVVLQEVNHPREIRVPVAKFVPRWNAYGRRQGYKGGYALALIPSKHPPRPAMPPC